MNAAPRPTNSATLAPRLFCKACGYPVIHLCCGYDMTDMEKYREWDYWGYCSNKACVNHDGEGWETIGPPPSFAVLASDEQLRGAELGTWPQP